ncbi:hypothetical protein [Microbacterium sp. NPDC091676]|uniref:hypothetical protein n=1 Tax=Microbacterium sp. NPDC091676 TaxID=3364212 RepID=UPI0038150C30
MATEILPPEDPNPMHGLEETEVVDGVRYERYHQPERSGDAWLVGATPEDTADATRWFLLASKRAARAHRI